MTPYTYLSTVKYVSQMSVVYWHHVKRTCVHLRALNMNWKTQNRQDTCLSSSDVRYLYSGRTVITWVKTVCLLKMTLYFNRKWIHLSGGDNCLTPIFKKVYSKKKASLPVFYSTDLSRSILVRKSQNFSSLNIMAKSLPGGSSSCKVTIHRERDRDRSSRYIICNVFSKNKTAWLVYHR